MQDLRGSRGVPIAGGSLGCGTLLLVGIFLVMGGDPGVVMQVLGEGQTTATAPPPGAPPAADDPAGAFVRTILADTEDVWSELFRRSGRDYPEPVLVLFEDQVRSGCGLGQASTGPFYCPADQKVYLDLSFFRVLQQRFQAPGDFAAAYVVAHEVGHHVQNVLGTLPAVGRQQRALSEAESNALSVRLELQADCYAGVWAHHANAQRQLLEEGDIGEGLRAAAAIGDDTLQRSSRGHVAPETFTHGTSEQRVRWFSMGLNSGDLQACDTFAQR